jgi:glycosyltransferase involved in cell wall biosynthesis
VRHAWYNPATIHEPTRTAARRQLKVAEDSFLFLYFGQLRNYKGIPHLIESFGRLAEEHVRLIIAGKPFNNAIASEIEKLGASDPRIRSVCNFIPEKDINVYMGAADVVVLPFTNVLTSGSLLLAMSHGKAVIVPAVGCVPEDVDERSGFLYDASDPAALHGAMVRALHAPTESMGNFNSRLAKNRTWRRMAEETAEIYKRCTIR